MNIGFVNLFVQNETSGFFFFPRMENYGMRADKERCDKVRERA